MGIFLENIAVIFHSFHFWYMYQKLDADDVKPV
jgi:hypothetical protein